MIQSNRAISLSMMGLALVLAGPSVRAWPSEKGQSPQPKVKAADIVRRVLPLIEALRAADELTTTRKPATLTRAGKTEHGGLSLVITRREKNLELETSVRNKVLGQEVPERSITVKVRVNCLVHCWLDLGKVRVHRDPDYPDTFVVRLPAPMRIDAEFPPGEDAWFEVEYGLLRSPLLDEEKARQLRKGLYRKALEKAKARFTEEWVRSRAELAAAVQADLRARFPGVRIHVRCD